jgi:hypothetical protein
MLGSKECSKIRLKLEKVVLKNSTRKLEKFILKKKLMKLLDLQKKKLIIEHKSKKIGMPEINELLRIRKPLQKKLEKNQV